MEKSEIVKMGYIIQQYLNEEKIVDAKPKDLMQILIEKGFFTKDYRKGLPLRKLLRELDDNDELYLLPQVRVERLEKRYWFLNTIPL